MAGLSIRASFWLAWSAFSSRLPRMVHRYHGNLTVETGGSVFRANVLLNL